MKVLNETQLEVVNGGGWWVHRKDDTNSSGYCVADKKEADRHVENNNRNDPGADGKDKWDASIGCSPEKQNKEAEDKQNG
ncbi:hypothetical protein [Motilimonas sp. E26]|uniref:hypothetical protein n=1 Tax=Motilimonas sp. E26 TaxID=2865674 RepID=UPI001E47923A|nr:hypothetical protein [Motilimonas sp. E26]MCE0557244.1 hypothetical protein [Motilimonas sp. E26]